MKMPLREASIYKNGILCGVLLGYILQCTAFDWWKDPVAQCNSASTLIYFTSLYKERNKCRGIIDFDPPLHVAAFMDWIRLD